ncbi:MAG: triose-phosphate isomerase [Gemmatimonadales bacterium]|nr:triose-phosphate isomerase [Gemmatimonadales bacterium]
MSRPLVFAANWKMHLTPDEARGFARTFLEGFAPVQGRSYWFFPSAVSLEATAKAFEGRPEIVVGAQDIYWEPKGAYTGATSVRLAQGAGARLTLIGHSERRHVFGESEDDTARKVGAALTGGLVPLLCVGETLAEREAGQTDAVVLRQLRSALRGLAPAHVSQVVLAYEPVWAIGTGRNATPEDAARVHAVLRAELVSAGHAAPRILYGGSVNASNAVALLAEAELDGVLVGGASLDAAGWRVIVGVGL